VTIERSFTSKTDELDLPKGGKVRTVALTPPARAALLTLPQGSTDRVFSGKKASTSKTRFIGRGRGSGPRGQHEIDWHSLRQSPGR
jgi:hypothetical protein